MNWKIYEIIPIMGLPILILIMIFGLFHLARTYKIIKWGGPIAALYLIIAADFINFLIFCLLLAPDLKLSFSNLNGLMLLLAGVGLGYVLYRVIYLPLFGKQKGQIRVIYPLWHWMIFSFATGFTEEAIWRGFFVTQIMATFEDLVIASIISVAASSLFFGFYHLGQGLKGIATMTFLGAILASIYIIFGSLLIPIFAHITYNLCIRFAPYKIIGLRLS